MSAIEELRSYLIQLRLRFRLAAVVRGGAIVIALALVATVILTVIINRFAFSTASLWSARAVLMLALGMGAAFGLAVPLWRLGQRWWARRAERTFPQFEQRLLTFAERDGNGSDPFLELLAADTLRVARATDIKSALPDAALLALLAVGIASLGSLVWLIRSGPGYLGYGAAALWTGPGPDPLYEVRVSPGDATVRRHADQLVTAQLRGMQRDRLQIHLRYQGAPKWEEATMQPRPAADGFQFLFAGVPADIEYFVQAGSVESPHFHLRVADVPTVKRIRVTYHHPDWTNLPDTVDENGGDLRAVEGTEALLEILTDIPMAAGVVSVDDGRRIALTAEAGNTYRGTVKMDKDGSYHIDTLERNRAVRVSDDYFIEASPVKPPEVALLRPERDYRASPIEEVTLAAKADDPFGLSEFALHYSVNGGPQKTLDLMREKGARSAHGSALIALESLKLAPGDVVAVYAAAKDGRSEAHTDISFIQVDPFEREFSQSQQAGGAGAGGGSANDQAQIAQREKEIIAATWKQDGLRNAPAQQAAEQAKFLSDVQSTLRGQSAALAGRLGMRDLQLANEQFGSFQGEMRAAATAMGPASQELAGQQWGAAVADEQKALQHLLRAEATFRQIEVAFASRGGGSAGVNTAGRDLASLFDLELDTQKNQYESAQTPFSNTQHAADIEAALRKLDELARRQSELSAQRGADSGQSAEQRWQQEMLRRAADELQQQIEQLANEGGRQGSAESGASGKRGASAGRHGASADGHTPAGDDKSAADAAAARQALNSLRQAEQEMRRAVDERSSVGGRRAVERLREAVKLLAGLQKQDVARQLEALNSQSEGLADRQREQAGRMGELRSGRGVRGANGGRPNGPVDVESLLADRQKLADDLARLTQDMRTAERQALERSHGAAAKLRDALGDLESSDTETHLQRSADMLRRGYLPLNDDAEAQIAADLKHLGEQLQDSRSALADGQPPGDDALDTVERLRNRLAALDQSLRASGAAAAGQPQVDSQSRGDADTGQADAQRGGSQQGGSQQGGSQQGGSPGSQLGRSQQSGSQGGARSGVGGPLAGPVGAVVRGGGYRDGPVDGAWNAGNNDPGEARPMTSGLPHAVGPERTAQPTESRQAYREGMSELGRLRRAVADDPQSRRQVDELIRSMQRLDPRRFPGNPAMVDELYARVLSGVDRLELQLRHEPVDDLPGQVRSGNSQPMPAGYRAAVAEYYRRLSRNP